MDFRDNIQKLDAYTPGFQPADASAVKINTNENPYPPSPKVFEALAKLDGTQLRRYPPVLWDSFRRAAAQVHGVGPEQIVCGNGGDELLSMLVRCCCDANRPLAYPVPTYTLYPVLARIQDCPVLEYDWAPGGKIPRELYDAPAALTILCNPNAPTCGFVPVAEIAHLARSVKGVLCIDEAYVDFAEDNCLSLLGRFENLVILRSLSKGYSLAGMRFGYVLTSAAIAQTLIKVKDSYNVNIAAQAAATAAIQDQGYFRQNIEKIKRQRQMLISELRNMGFTAPESQTNFILADCPGGNAEKIGEKLAQMNIYVRYFSIQPLRNKLRITVGTEAENRQLLLALRNILTQL